MRKRLFAIPFLTKNRTFVNPGSKKARHRLDTGTSSAGVQAAFVVNRSDKPITVSVPLAALGVKDGVKVYDIWVRKPMVATILYLKPNIYQDRLGTSIGKVEKDTFVQGKNDTGTLDEHWVIESLGPHDSTFVTLSPV